MTASIRISAKCARSLFELLRGKEIDGAENCAAVMQLADALSKASRASAARRTLAKPKQAKRRAKGEVTRAIRAVCMDRARGRCESCGTGGGMGLLLELDHFWGRGKTPQSLENCWLLCWTCHRAKTASRPGAAFWLLRFAKHCEKAGYTAEATKARQRLAFVEARNGVAP